MCPRRLLTAVLLVTLFALPLTGHAGAPPKLKVAFINSFPNEPWAGRFTTAMKAAAEDLDIELAVHRAAWWPTETASQVRALLDGPDRPAYLVISIHRGASATLLQIAEEAHVPVFVVNAGLLDVDRRRYGGPREYFRWWIGQMLPDDELAGFDLTNILIDHARSQRHRQGFQPLSIVALSGMPVDFANVERIKGFHRAIAHQQDVNLLQVISADWDFEVAAQKTALMLERYPAVDMIWAANDSMAMGAVKAIHQSKRNTHPAIAVGGMNWEPRALEALASGELTVTMDGHFLEGAWAMVLIHDHARGIDFASERIDWRTPLQPITGKSGQEYIMTIDDSAKWQQVDFRRFSKAENHALARYDFTLQAFLAQLRGGR